MATAGCCIGAFLVIFSLLMKTGHSIQCYQCTSINNEDPFQCNEFLTSDVDLQPESCDDVYGARYCVKHVGRFEGGIGTKRFCSAVDMGNYCDYVKQPGDKLTYRTCVYTCTGHGCNPATSSMPSATHTWIMPVGLLVVWRMMFHR
ncbi:U-scoloptoxin(05)-Sm1a [Formica exsecta]|uniref:U-scoloptoxin(05)-Sm1a n=1 Tax=Formica exsecta TaxID=72781 RepID=UPI0011449B53|nr:U-scoloptoxin(05)-Sm1a [Formica exsecta]